MLIKKIIWILLFTLLPLSNCMAMESVWIGGLASAMPTNSTKHVHVVGPANTNYKNLDIFTSMPVPIEGRVSDLYVHLNGNVGAGESYIYTLLKNGAATTITCTVSGAADVTCIDTDNIVTFSANDTVSLKIVSSASATTRLFRFTLRFETANEGESVLMGSSGSNQIVANRTRYLPVNGGTPYDSSEKDVMQIISTDGTARNLYVITDVAPGAGETYTITLRTGVGITSSPSVDTALTCTISGALDTTCTDLVNTVSFTATSPATTHVAMKIVSSSAAASMRIKFGFVYDADTDGHFIIPHSSDTTVPLTGNQFAFLETADLGYATTEANRRSIIIPFKFDNIYAQMHSDPTGSCSVACGYVFTLRENLLSTGQTCTAACTPGLGCISGGCTGSTDVEGETFSYYDSLIVNSNISLGGTGSKVAISYDAYLEPRRGVIVD